MSLLVNQVAAVAADLYGVSYLLHQVGACNNLPNVLNNVGMLFQL